MPVVVADTGPLNYLVQIDAIELLPKLFDGVITPATVHQELSDPRAPEAVRAWAAVPPPWLQIRPNPDSTSEIAEPRPWTMASARQLHSRVRSADLILMDDRDDVAFARSQGFAVTGTLGILDLAARRGLIDLPEAFTRLKATTFHYRQDLLDALLARQPEEKNNF